MELSKTWTRFILLLALLCGLAPGLYALETTASEHFVVYHHQDHARLVESLLRNLEKTYPLVSMDVGYTLNRPVRVYLTASSGEFQALTSGTIPDWGIGCAYPDSSLMVLKADAEIMSRGNLEEIAVHELTHIVLNQAVGDARIPRWLDEGLAMYESREWSFGQGFTMAKAVFTRSVIPLHRIDAVLTFDRDKAQLAYTESFLAVSYLIQEYGLESFHRIIRRLAATDDIDRAFMDTIGLRYREFEMLWSRHVARRYGWVSFLTDSYYLWIGISVLFILAFLIKKYRAKRTMERWETETEIEDRRFDFDDEQDYYDY